MSNLDPLAAIAARAALAAQNFAADTAVDLGVPAEVLQSQINVGDLLDAIVLPPQNGVDRISLLGQTVAAQLPPGIDPGESILLQVTGFQGQQIYVRNLGAIDSENPPPVVNVQFEPSPEGAPRSAVLTTNPAPQSPAPPANASMPAVAPPREVFVAASVRPNANAGVPAQQRVAVSKQDGEVEVRLAVNRTTLPPRTSQTQASPAAVRSEPQPAPAALRNLPPVISRGAPGAPAQTPQASLLARLRVPISASTLVAVRLADDAARHVTSSYQRLDLALSKLQTGDPRVGSLRSLLAFVGKLDLRNSRALPEQIAAFISHVVDGAENKVAQIVRALTAVAEQALPEEQTPAASQTAAPPTVQTAAVAAPTDLPPAVAARVAERTVALDHDVKSAIMELIQNPPRETTPQVTQALSSALGATTALQLNVLSAQNTDPNAIAIPLPAYFYEGGKPAQLSISREAPGGRKKLDGDNFHVSFVLDTKTMGTVAIDLQTVGRSVSLNVKTERQSAASRFHDTLTDLRGRLEGLRYRVASMAAGVATAPANQASAAVMPPSAKAEVSKTNVDMRA